MFDWRLIPVKMGEPKRIMAALFGFICLVGGNVTSSKFASWILYGAGTTALGMTVAGIVNPVTVYTGDRYGSTINSGLVTGQASYPWGYSPEGAYYGADGVTQKLYTPGVFVKGNGISPTYVLPAAGTDEPIVTRDTISYGSTTTYEGEVLGQGDTGSRTLSYGADGLPDQSGGNIPALYYGGVVADDAAGIYIREPGETQFL